MVPNKDEQQILHELLLENQKLLIDNNQLLKKMNNRSVLAFWMRFIWFMILIGVPVALYYYVLEPYVTSFGDSIETLQNSVQQIPGVGRFIEAAQDSRGE